VCLAPRIWLCDSGAGPRSSGEVIDGHLRLKAARKIGSRPGCDTSTIPVIPCDGWTDAQVKAFRLTVNRSVTWTDWDEDALALELQELQESDFDLSLTGFNPGEIDNLLLLDNEERANATPPLPETPVSRLGDLWLCGKHRVLCGDATSPEPVARLLGERKPRLMVTDPPFGIELDPKYVDVVVQRWQSLSNKKATLDADGRTFDEIARERREEVA
jgi:hypothetical protein